MTGLPQPPSVKKDASLTEDETMYILTSTLKSKHAADPVVIDFIIEFLNCRDLRQAAEYAGITFKRAKALKAQPDVYECIRRMNSKAVEKFGYSAEDVVEKVKEISEADMRYFQKPDGSWVNNLNDVPREISRAVVQFEVKNIFGTDPNGMPIITGEIIKVKFDSKLKASELLGREKDLFVEKKRVELDATADMKQILLGANMRAEERLKQLERDVVDVQALPMPPGGKS